MNFTFGLLSSSKGNSVETTGILASNSDVETAGSLAYLNVGGGVDFFGSKDIFGNVDFSNMEASFFADASSVETAGSIACADFGFSAGDFASLGGGDFGGAASVSCESSFSSVC